MLRFRSPFPSFSIAVGGSAEATALPVSMRTLAQGKAKVTRMMGWKDGEGCFLDCVGHLLSQSWNSQPLGFVK